MPTSFRRKNIRLPREWYLGFNWYHLTACTQDREQRFRDSAMVSWLLKLLSSEAAAKGFALQAYCFMPDHLHLLASGTRYAADFLAFTNGFKQRSAYEFKKRTGERLWQPKFHDHILRPTTRWEAVAYYIWMNPVRKGLCGRAQDWPFSGPETVDWRSTLGPPEEPWVPPWK